MLLLALAGKLTNPPDSEARFATQASQHEDSQPTSYLLFFEFDFTWQVKMLRTYTTKKTH